MFKNKIFIFLPILFFLSSCGDTWQAVKKGLTNQKEKSTDEFLVKKKDPLNMPPKWKDLPKPGQNITLDDEVEEVTDIEELIQLGKNQKSLTNLEQGDGNLEDSVLKVTLSNISRSNFNFIYHRNICKYQ